MTITQNGATATYEFELPKNSSDEIVTAVDVENSTITVVPSGRTNAGGEFGEFAIGDVYDGDISGLVGRTVNIGTNSDNKVVKISVNDEDVVTGKMKYVEGSKSDAQGQGVANLKDSYFEDALTGTKYYFSSTNTSNVNYTQAFKAWNGDDFFRAGDDGLGNLVVLDNDFTDKATYDYVQLTLNVNGTVAVAMVDPRWTSNILVNDVVGTIIVESEKMTLDVDGYTIVKGGVYVEPEDLEEGDVVYYDTTNKFAEVYNDEVTGTIEKVTSEKVTVDGVKYNWDGAKYYDSSSKAYKTLDGVSDNIGAQKYLNSLSTEDDVTIVLNRGGDIAYITGTEEETAADSNAVYMTNRLGQAYSQDLKHYAKITLNDGEDQSVTVDLSKLTSYAGKALEDGGATIHVNGEDTAQPWKTTLDFDFTVASGKDDLVGVPVGSATATSLKDTTKTDGQFPIGALVKVTTNPAGVVVGLEKLGSVGTMTATSKDSATDGAQLDPDDTTITAGGKVLALNASTRIWVIDKDLKVKKIAFSDYENKTAAGKADLVSVYADGTKASDIVINNLDGDTYSEATEDYASGIVMDYQMAANGSVNEVSDITIKAADGIDYEFNGTGKKNTDKPGNGNYVVLTLDKDTTNLHDDGSIAEYAWSLAGVDTNGDTIKDLWMSTLTPGRGSNATTLLPENGTTLTAKTGALILKRTDADADGKFEYAPIEIGTINAATNKLNVFWHAVDINGIKMTADIIIVEEVALTEAGVAVLKPITGALATGDVIGTWTDNQDGTEYLKSNAGRLELKDKDTGVWNQVATVSIPTGTNNIIIGSNYTPLAEREYRLLISAGALGTATSAKYTAAASNTIKTAAAEKKTMRNATTGGTAQTSDTIALDTVGVTPTTAEFVYDQFGVMYKTKDVGIVDTATANITSADGTITKGVAELAVNNTGAVTIKVKSVKVGQTVRAGDIFKFFGCEYTITGFTGATYATTAAPTSITGYTANKITLGAVTLDPGATGETAAIYLSTDAVWDGAATDILVGTIDELGAATVIDTSAGKLAGGTSYYQIVVPDSSKFAPAVSGSGTAAGAAVATYLGATNTATPEQKLTNLTAAVVDLDKSDAAGAITFDPTVGGLFVFDQFGSIYKTNDVAATSAAFKKADDSAATATPTVTVTTSATGAVTATLQSSATDATAAKCVFTLAGCAVTVTQAS